MGAFGGYLKDPEEWLEEVKQSLKSKREFKPSSMERRKQTYEENRAARSSSILSRIPFINDETGLLVYPGVVLVGGISGRGKSTLLSNLLSGFIKSKPDKKAVIITNEDLLASIYDRTACILTETSFFRYFDGQVTQEQEIRVQECVKQLMDRVEVVDDPNYDMSCIEDVCAVLEYAARADLGLVAIDYYQTITHSRENPSREYYQVLKDFGFWLKGYARKIPQVPVVTLVQLTGNKEAEFKERVEADRTIYNHAFQVFELETDIAVRQTRAKIVKDRWGGQQGKEVVMHFRDGRYEVDFDL